MSKGNSKTNHHYVPRGYLAHFTIPGEKSLIWQYDKLAQKFSKTPKSINKIASRKNYYAFTSNTGGLDTNTIEDAFQKIETEAISIIRQIFPGKLSILLNNNHEKINILSYYMAIQAIRTPSYRDTIRQLYEWSVKQTALSIFRGQAQDGILPDFMRDTLKGAGIEIVVEEFVSLWHAHDGATAIHESLLKKDWSFIFSRHNHGFITSDMPFCLVNIFKNKKIMAGPAHKLSSIYIPLRNDLALFISPNENYISGIHGNQDVSFRMATDEYVDAFNAIISRCANRYIYTSSRHSKLEAMFTAHKYKKRNHDHTTITIPNIDDFTPDTKTP